MHRSAAHVFRPRAATIENLRIAGILFQRLEIRSAEFSLQHVSHARLGHIDSLPRFSGVFRAPPFPVLMSIYAFRRLAIEQDANVLRLLPRLERCLNLGPRAGSILSIQTDAELHEERSRIS